MSLMETFSLAIKNISGSKTRTFLTMLGIIIGVCAVIVIVGLGNGMAGYMEDSFAEMGTNTLTVSIMGRGTSRTVSEEQMYQIVEDNADYLDQISPTVSMTGSVKIGSSTYSSTSVSGVGETWFEMKGYEIAQGRGIEYMDIVDRKKVCVVGSYVAQTCFGGDAVGQSLKVGGTTFSIVGVMAQEAEEMEEGGTDDCVYVPYSTAARLSFTGTISSYTITVTEEDYAALGKESIETALYKIFQDEDAYTVVSMAEMLDTMLKRWDIWWPTARWTIPPWPWRISADPMWPRAVLFPPRWISMMSTTTIRGAGLCGSIRTGFPARSRSCLPTPHLPPL